MTNNKDHEGEGLLLAREAYIASCPGDEDFPAAVRRGDRDNTLAMAVAQKAIELVRTQPPASEGLVTDAMIDQLQAKITELAVMELDADEENTLQINAFGDAVEKELRSLIAALQAQPAADVEGRANIVRLALEDADTLDRIAEEADENGWQDWGAVMRQSAMRTRAALSSDIIGGR